MKTVIAESSPTMTAIVDNVENFDDIDRLPCPYCNGQMLRVDNGDYPHEQYKNNGWFARTERFYCENCWTWAEVTQTYRPEGRFVKVRRDMEE